MVQKNDTPEISVIMGVYEKVEKVDLLKKSIQSILKQTITDFEFLICADGSDEEIHKILKEYQKKDSRVFILSQNKEYSTLAEKLNFCLANARGKYIARQDADDISKEQRLEKQLKFIKSTSVDFVGTNVYLYDKKGIYGQRLYPEKPMIKDFLYVQPYIHPTLMIRTKVMKSVGGYDKRRMFERCEDFDFLMRMYQNGFSGMNMEEKLLLYYVDRKEPVTVSYKYRINEAYVRYINFKRNGMLPKAILYVLKPLVVGCLPVWLYKKLKKVDYINE